MPQVIECLVLGCGIRAELPSVGANRRGVEKLNIHKISVILGDGEWSDSPHKPFVGHLDATSFGLSFQT
jgi:hypothetical protein